MIGANIGQVFKACSTQAVKADISDTVLWFNTLELTVL